MNVKYVAYVAVMFLIVCGGYFAYADVYHYSDRIEVDGEEVLVQGDTWTTSQNASNHDLSEVRNLYTNGTPSVNIMSYGAIPDDGLDDWSAIQTAINATYDMGGGIVFFPSGRFHISKELRFWGGIKYEGATPGYNNNGTEIYLLDDSNVTMISIDGNPDGSNSYFPFLENLMLNGNRAHQTAGHGIHIGQGTRGDVLDVFMSDVTVFNAKEYGFVLNNSKMWISNIYAEYCNKGVYVGGNLNRIFIERIYCVLNYEESFVVEGNLRMLTVSGGVIGDSYGSCEAIRLEHTTGSVFFSDLEIGGPKTGYSSDAIINISTSGTAYSSISDVLLRSQASTSYGLWVDSSVTGSEYNIENINIESSNIANNDNGVQYTEKTDDGIKYHNMNLDFTSQILHETTKQGIIIQSNFNNESIDGTTVLDSSTNNNHLTSVSATHDYSGGFNDGGCYVFDGTSSYIYRDAVSEITSSGDYTFCAYMNSTNTSKDQVIIQNSLGGSDRNGVTISDGSVRVGYSDGSWHGASATISENTYYDVCGVKNNSGLFLFIDGELPTQGTDNPYLGSSLFTVGAGASGLNHFEGNIDEIRVYNWGLSADEIKANYRKRTESPNSFVSQKDILVSTTAIYPQNNVDFLGAYGISNIVSFTATANLDIGPFEFEAGNVTTDLLIDITANASIVVCSATIEGSIYYDGGTNKHRGCDGTNWNDLY